MQEILQCGSLHAGNFSSNLFFTCTIKLSALITETFDIAESFYRVLDQQMFDLAEFLIWPCSAQLVFWPK